MLVLREVSSEYLAAITPHPTRIKGIPYLVLPTWDSTAPRPLTRFYSFPQLIDCSFRWSQFDYQKPQVLVVIGVNNATGFSSDEVRGNQG